MFENLPEKRISVEKLSKEVHDPTPLHSRGRRFVKHQSERGSSIAISEQVGYLASFTRTKLLGICDPGSSFVT